MSHFPNFKNQADFRISAIPSRFAGSFCKIARIRARSSFGIFGDSGISRLGVRIVFLRLFLDCLDEEVDCLFDVGHFSEGEAVEADAEGPDVGGFWVEWLLERLRRHKVKSPFIIRQLLPLLNHLRHPKIPDFDRPILHNENITRLQIPVNNLSIVKVLNPIKCLRKKAENQLFRRRPGFEVPRGEGRGFWVSVEDLAFGGEIHDWR